MRIRAGGELDAAGAERLEARIRAAEAHRPDVLVLDLRAVTFVDSSAVRVLLVAARRARADRRRVVLRIAPGGQVQRAFRLMRIDRRLEVVAQPIAGRAGGRG